MDCQLNKPLCKRKAMLQRGAFKMKETCPATKDRKCAISRRQCPLLPQSEDNCPVTRLLGQSKQGTSKCPLALGGCPCDPNPPCPLDYDTDDEAVKNMNNFINRVMAEHKAKGKRKTKKRSLPMDEESLKNIPLNFDEKLAENSSSSGEEDTSSDTSSVASKRSVDIIYQKALIEEDQPYLQRKISKEKQKETSNRGFCNKCIVETPKNNEVTDDKKKDIPCKFLKIEKFCNNICPCDEIKPINTDPACPFAPKPCSCCAPKKCPLIKDPECPISPPKPVTCCCPPKCALSSPKCRCIPSNCPYANDGPSCNCSCPPRTQCPPKPPCAPQCPPL
ncbi:hypothetical protein O3M35_012979 [Rhynocoris fuscipes]|uniref:Uncharacterized protein n=1 Tax=Rhynocoris fuscipes TaxID=488301 RepID=A0AAW1CFE6_9HEMI